MADIQKQFIELTKNATTQVESAKTLEEIERVEQELFGRKSGILTIFLKQLKDLSEAERRSIGAEANALKEKIQSEIAVRRAAAAHAGFEKIAIAEAVDITEPSLPATPVGHTHPTTVVQRDLEDLFTSMGFVVLSGPELESDYYNFTALNIPADHPARDMQDTFYIKNHPTWVMRTHTSPMQVRAMQKYGAPLRAIVPGVCFRNESTDVRHEHTFHQMEGFVVAEHITIAHMKGVLETVAKHLYGNTTAVRLRPKYYPFVEPGVNGEVTCFTCAGKGCRLCKHSGWLEIFGAGMVHPNVLKEGGVDAKKYRGFAFGFGLTRLVMLKYGIDDVRLLESGDLRFLEQF